MEAAKLKLGLGMDAVASLSSSSSSSAKLMLGISRAAPNPRLLLKRSRNGRSRLRSSSSSSSSATTTTPPATTAEKRKEKDLVFVAGATGRVGSRVVRELIRLGFRVRAAVRNAQRTSTLLQSVQQLKLDDEASPAEKLEIVECDLEKQPQESLVSAIGNAALVVCSIGASEKEIFDVTGPYRIDYMATNNLVQAATAAKVEHFILVTSLGTNKIGFPAFLLNLFWGVLCWKRRAEEALIASGIPYTIVRPGGMERPTDGYKETHNLVVAAEDTYVGGQVSNLQVAELIARMASNRKAAYCKVVEVIAETTAPLLPMDQLLSAIPSNREPPTADEEEEEQEVKAEDTTVKSESGPATTAAARPLSPYTAYEGLKPPSSPSPTSASSSNKLQQVVEQEASSPAATSSSQPLSPYTAEKKEKEGKRIERRAMEILSPSPPPSRYREGEACVHVAVGRSPEKTLGLLRWALRRFGCGRRIALLHVHQPSPLIPTLLGKIPAGQATEELVLSHRKSEKEEMNKTLLAYLAFCHRAQVQATLLVTENDQIHDGILTLVTRYGITKLVMGSTPDNCFKLKGSYGKESLMARNAPPFCEIWFVWRGRHIWTREATGNNIPQDDVITTKRIRFSSYSNNAECILDQGYINQGIASDCDRSIHHQPLGANHFYNMSIANWQDAEESALNSAFRSNSSLHMETLQLYSKEILDTNLKQVMMETEVSRKEAFLELLKRKETESQVASAFSRAKASESTKKHEIKVREELEVLLVATRKQHEDLINNKEKAVAGLESSMRRLAILDDRTKKISVRMDEVAAELEVIQSSIETLRKEKSKMQTLEDRHIDHIERCTYSHATQPNCMSITFGGDSYRFEELTLLDMQSATCKFSETFKIRSGSHGCVYKGEILDKSVMIHKLQSQSIQSVRQFQQELYILRKVRHPHLLTLVGACPEALCLVYEYLPNVSLHDCLFTKCNGHQLPWKIRARIIAEISGALLFLHSCKPQMIIHGDLKLENILLDTDFHCKVADFGISRIFSDGTKDYPSCFAGSELKGSFPYADPEHQRTQVLTPKSDIYYFGIVILQLLTGKQEPAALASEVRRAMSCGKLSSVLDSTAGEWPMEVAGRLAEFGIRCSEASSRSRPELTPGTVQDLEQLHLMKERRIPSSFLCPISQQVMHDPQVCSDGSTYEGRAIREWMENGRETSPVTNLQLEHRDLTPNHALRFAIQDWLSHSHPLLKL